MKTDFASSLAKKLCELMYQHSPGTVNYEYICSIERGARTLLRILRGLVEIVRPELRSKDVEKSIEEIVRRFLREVEGGGDPVEYVDFVVTVCHEVFEKFFLDVLKTERSNENPEGRGNSNV